MTDTKEVSDVYLHAGGLLMFSSGEYSDYGTNGCFVALEDLTRSGLHELAEETQAEHKRLDEQHDEALDAWEKAGRPKGGYPQWPGDVKELFIAACIRKGWLLSVTYTELHIGSYGRLDLGL